MSELFPSDFMRRFTDFLDLDEMFKASGFRVESTEDFAKIPDDAGTSSSPSALCLEAGTTCKKKLEPNGSARNSVSVSDPVTISVARRKDDVRAVLIRLSDIVGDDHRIEHHFSPEDPRFSDLIETTWREMLDADLLELRGRSLALTGFGWITGLRLSGRLQSAEVGLRAQAVVRALKARVKGRHGLHDEFVDVRQLAPELQLPVGWLWNALDADLLQKVFPKDRINARLDQQHKTLIKIPPTFGSDPVDIE